MPPLAITAIELAFHVISEAIASGELTPEQVAARIKSAQAPAPASEARVDERIGDA